MARSELASLNPVLRRSGGLSGLISSAVRSLELTGVYKGHKCWKGDEISFFVIADLPVITALKLLIVKALREYKSHRLVAMLAVLLCAAQVYLNDLRFRTNEL